jgi:hypothetical protein
VSASNKRKRFLRSKPRGNETPSAAAERIVVTEGNTPLTLEQATLMKETYLAKLRELEYDLKVRQVQDAKAALIAEYGSLRSVILARARSTAGGADKRSEFGEGFA